MCLLRQISSDVATAKISGQLSQQSVSCLQTMAVTGRTLFVAGFLIICTAAECATAVITTADQSICACALSRTRQLERRAATGHSDILIVNVKTNMSFSALKWVDKWTLAIYKAIRCDLKGYKGLAFTKPCRPGFVAFVRVSTFLKSTRTAEKKQRKRILEADKSI